MCGRFTLSHTTEEVAERFSVQTVLFELTPRFNIAPSQPIPVVRQNGQRLLEGLRWGLVPFWAKDPQIGNRMINARAETIAEKPAFKKSLLQRRCLIPADGFYEWMRQGKAKQPMHIHTASGDIFAFAGLWDEWRGDDGNPLRTCTIITTTPNELMSGIHDRMPAILRREDEELWLDNSIKDAPELLNLLRPYPDDALRAQPVSTAVNSPVFDSPQCVESIVDETDQGGTEG